MKRLLIGIPAIFLVIFFGAPFNAFAADEPGLGFLDQATEAKLQAQTPVDLGNVIALCQKARKEGLSGENLKYCDQLLGSCLLQRGTYFAQTILIEGQRAGNWKELRTKAVADLEAAVSIINNQAKPYLMLAELQLLEDGDQDKAAKALDEAARLAGDDPSMFLRAISLKAKIEKDPVKREKIFADAAKSGDIRIILTHASMLFGLKKDAEAVKVLENLVESHKDDSEILSKVYALLTEQGEYEPALKILNQLEKSGDNEGKEQFALQKAGLLAEMRRFDEALPILDELRKKHPNKAEILVIRSDLFLEMDEPDKAMKDIDAALRLRSGNPALRAALMLQKIKALSQKEQYDDALAVVKDLQGLESSETKLAANRVLEIQLLLKLKRFDEAIEIAQELQKKEPDEMRRFDVLVEIYIEKKDFGKAEKILNERRNAEPDEEIWTRRLLAVYAAAKKYDDAMKVLDELIKKNPDKTAWLIVKAQLLVEQTKETEAVGILDEHLKQHPDDREIALAAIAVLSESKKNRAAWERLKPLLEKSPEDTALLRVKSQIAIGLALHDEAVKALEKVISDTPKDSLSLNNLSWLYSTSPLDMIRNGERALELAERACKETRYKEAYILSTLAAAYAELRDFEKAKEWSQKSIDLVKSDQKAIDKTDEKSVKRNAELLENLQKELKSYKDEQPFREALEEEK